MSTADAILQRLLLLLPVAHEDRSRKGIPIDDLARDFGVEPKRILRDIEELEERSYYLPAGLSEQIQLRITDRVSVWTSGEFKRPVRLTPREAMALELGLRVLCHRDGDAELEKLRAHLIAPLRTGTTEDHPDRDADAGTRGADGDPSVGLGPFESTSDPIYATVHRALEDRREVDIHYRALGRTPSSRRVAPLLLARAEGHWYLLARDRSDDGVRAFRMDRILRAEACESSFEPRDDDAEAVERFLGDGRVHDGGAGRGGGGVGPDDGRGDSEDALPEAVIEYSAVIARWIREHDWGRMEEAEGGAVRVRHPVHDPEWIVRHVLGYGPEARVVEPDSIRERVIAAARRLTESPAF